MDNKYSNSYNTLRPQSYNNFSTTNNKNTNLNSSYNEQIKSNISTYSNRDNSSSQSNSFNTFGKQPIRYPNQSSIPVTTGSTNSYKVPQLTNLQGSTDLAKVQRAQQITQQSLNKSYSNLQGFKQDNLSFKSNTSTQNLFSGQDYKKKDQNDLSWTKYIGMELKTEELQKLVGTQQNQLQQKTKKISQLQRTLSITKWDSQKNLKKVQNQYQSQIRQQKQNYQSEIITKNKQIKNLLQKLTDETKSCLTEEVQNYLSQIFNSNSDLTTQLAQYKKNQQDMNLKIAQFEQQSTNDKQLIQKNNQSIRKLSLELSQLGQRFLKRITPSSDNNSFIKILQIQSIQIDQLRASIDNLQTQNLNLRLKLGESQNMLKNALQQYNIGLKKLRIQHNNLVSQLSFKLTQKQYEISSLSRRLKSAQSRLKSASQENIIKNNLIQGLQLKYKNNELEQHLSKLINQFMERVQVQQQSYSNQQQLNTLRKKMSLLQI